MTREIQMQIAHTVDQGDIKKCAHLWLQASLVAHDFIPAQFWHASLAAMEEEYLPQSSLYVARHQEAILGFAAVSQGILAALFVEPRAWSQGVGTALLHHVQQKFSALTLSVYSQNSRAVRFYVRHGFTPVQEQHCAHTGAPELIMAWQG